MYNIGRRRFIGQVDGRSHHGAGRSIYNGDSYTIHTGVPVVGLCAVSHATAAAVHIAVPCGVGGNGGGQCQHQCQQQGQDPFHINHLAEAFRRSRNKSRFHSVVCEFLRFSSKQDWISRDLSCFVPQIRAHKPTPSIYSAEEVEQVLNCIDALTISGKRKRAVFLIVARLGLRNSDVCELQFSNIDWGKKMISLVQKKTGTPIALPLLPEIEEAIREYIAVRPESDLPYVFLRNRAPFLPLRNTTVVYELRSLFVEAGINTQGKRCSPHTLRSSLASALLREGISYPIIQKVLGHSSPTATKYYAKVDIARLRDCALEVPIASGKFSKLIGGDSNA